MALPTITAFDWVPDVARGQVRDLRVRWALEEVGQPYAVRYLSQGEQKQPAHRALQPYGQVPTFEDGTLTLFESGAIVLHVAERGALLPDDAAGRAHALEWSFAALNSVEPPIMDHAIATLFEADAPWSAPRLPAIEQRIRERLFDTARRLGDLLMIAVLRILRDDPLLAEQPTLLAYVERGEARPAFARALADQMAGFTGSPPPEIVAWLEQRQQREEIRR
ncbi:glutathione S-transferase family protein [Sphingomonas sp.]|jgi:glutathione S-transferase|uniref:glutathione S-transferase family protein n=1 Tax=Sphingomonas sp. TaxID=28214 RepID=UPI0035C8300B